MLCLCVYIWEYSGLNSSIIEHCNMVLADRQDGQRQEDVLGPEWDVYNRKVDINMTKEWEKKKKQKKTRRWLTIYSGIVSV